MTSSRFEIDIIYIDGELFYYAISPPTYFYFFSLFYFLFIFLFLNLGLEVSMTLYVTVTNNHII